jgi:hypothetical protein
LTTAAAGAAVVPTGVAACAVAGAATATAAATAGALSGAFPRPDDVDDAEEEEEEEEVYEDAVEAELVDARRLWFATGCGDGSRLGPALELPVAVLPCRGGAPILGGAGGGPAAVEGTAGAADGAGDGVAAAGLAAGFLDRNCCSHSCARDSPEVRALYSSSMSLSSLATLRTTERGASGLASLRLPITSRSGDARESSSGLARGPPDAPPDAAPPAASAPFELASCLLRRLVTFTETSMTEPS